jgi:nitrilase
MIWAQGSPATLRAVSTTLRGVRVNLAAAICWESYMPLLRQALYSQNINLYLAPTADARDSWLSLMRTVSLEGRCVVVSSNMAEREMARGGDEAGGGAVEIALPTKSSVSPSRRRRRKSVFDEDGNEIVLGCPDDADGAEGAAEGEQQRANGAARHRKQGGAGAGSGWASRGGSCIISPTGEVLAGPQWEDDEGLIYADVDFRDCIRGRLDFDAGGSYSRNDSFNFSVNGLNLDPLPY